MTDKDKPKHRQFDTGALIEAQVQNQDPANGRFIAGNKAAWVGAMDKARALKEVVCAEIVETGYQGQVLDKYGISSGTWNRLEHEDEWVQEQMALADGTKLKAIEANFDAASLHYINCLDDNCTRCPKIEKFYKINGMVITQMMVAKKLDPNYRDSVKIEQTNNIVNVADINSIADAVWRKRQHDQTLIEGEVKELPDGQQ